jgi:VIT1/CCC1 family predicted Fe2+/Mn2+ transporter
VSSSTATTVEARALALAKGARRRPLDPIDRFSEIIFGLIMVLTFTGTVRVAEGGREQIRDMLVAALGCNVAWGIVDGVMFVVTSVVDRARKVAVLRGIRAADPARGRDIVLAALPEGVATVTDAAEAERMAARARALPDVPLRLGIRWDDVKGAIASCLLTVAATFPPTIPFLVFRDDVRRALLVSNAVAVFCLFVSGWFLGKATGARPGVLGLAMVVVGVALVGVTILLGG